MSRNIHYVVRFCPQQSAKQSEKFSQSACAFYFYWLTLINFIVDKVYTYRYLYLYKHFYKGDSIT